MISTPVAFSKPKQYAFPLDSLIHSNRFKWINLVRNRVLHLKHWIFKSGYTVDVTAYVKLSDTLLLIPQEPDTLEQSLKKNLQNSIPYDNLQLTELLSQINTFVTYLDRIQILTDNCVEEGIELNKDSVTDFLSFISASLFTHEATLVLSDNGHIVAIWGSEDEDYLDIQFLGNQKIAFVIFKNKTESTLRTGGEGPFESVFDKISELELSKLVTRYDPYCARK